MYKDLSPIEVKKLKKNLIIQLSSWLSFCLPSRRSHRYIMLRGLHIARSSRSGQAEIEINLGPPLG